MLDRTALDMRLAAHQSLVSQASIHGWKHEETRSRIAYRMRLSRVLLRAAIWLAPAPPPVEPDAIALALKAHR